MPSFRTLAPGRHVHEIEIRRSRFLTWLARARCEDEARAIVEEARRAHPAARHHCSAFIVPAPGDVADVERSSDDGEPAGTAGSPMLDVLRTSGLREVVAVVTRYFGGVKLGTGGLVRAYSESVSAAIDTAPTVRVTAMSAHRLDLPHAEAGRIEAALRDLGFAVVDVAYTELAHLTIAARDVAALRATVAELSSGTATLTPTGQHVIERPER